MTPDEARTLLDMIRMVDNKIGEPDDARAILWAEILGGMTLEKALAGMREHYRTSSETIMPAHIRDAAERAWNVWEGRKRSHVARNNSAIEGRPVAISEEDKEAARARVQSNHSPEVASALADLRAKLGPAKRGVLDGSWQVKYRGTSRDDRKPRSSDPTPLKTALRMVSSQVRPGKEDVA